MRPMPPRILINGAKGRMGQALQSAAADLGLTVSAAVDVGDDLAAALAACDVIVDFSSHRATRALLELAITKKKAIVVGTTGHPAAEKAALLALAAQVPCVWAGNFSVGVNLLFALTRRASAVLGSDYDTEVIEMHHRFKQDAPSGTAERLLEIICEERKLGAESLRHGRRGITGERTPAEIRCAAATSWAITRLCLPRWANASSSRTRRATAASSPAGRCARRSGSSRNRRAFTTCRTCLV
jgi:4-hydroxy-tetrahydrodipicolinate reductase